MFVYASPSTDMSTLRYATARADKSREYSYNKEKNHKLYTG